MTPGVEGIVLPRQYFIRRGFSKPILHRPSGREFRHNPASVLTVTPENTGMLWAHGGNAIKMKKPQSIVDQGFAMAPAVGIEPTT